MTMSVNVITQGAAADRDARISAAAGAEGAAVHRGGQARPGAGHPARLDRCWRPSSSSSSGAQSFGRYLYALGSNRTVATLSGVPVARTTITAYAISGMTAALAGILLTGYSRQAYLGMGDPYLFTSIAAVAIGGASILGGTGSYLGTIAGALVLTILTGVLPIFRLDAGALRIIYGLVILVTVSIAAPSLRDLLRRRGSS